MALNEGVNWDQAGDTVTDSKSGTRVKDAFKSGKAEKVLLKAGTQLYKFNAYPTLGRGNEEEAKTANPRSAEASEYYSQVLSPWWSPYQPFKHDAGWQAKKQLASHLQVSVRELGRNTSAIKENWNSLRYLLVINLKQPTYAFFGGFSQMPRKDVGAKSKMVTTAPEGATDFVPEAKGGSANLPGGATQFYLPNLRPANVQNWRTESLLNL